MREERGLSRLAALLLALSPTRAVVAQNMVPPPAPLVANLPLPGPRTIVGVVFDTSGSPLDSVNIAILDPVREQVTGPNGRFRLGDLNPGAYVVRAHRIGFLPQVYTFVVGTHGGTGAFALSRAPSVLPVIVSTGARGGLMGQIGDTSYHALRGAEIAIMGTRMRTVVSDSSCGFFVPLPEGHYLLNIGRAGYASRLVSVDIPRDSGRYLSVLLKPGDAAPGEDVALDRLRERLAQRRAVQSEFVTRAEAMQLGLTWLTQIQLAGAAHVGLTTMNILRGECPMVIQDGVRAVPAYSIAVDQIEAVEVYAFSASTGVTDATSATTRRKPNVSLMGGDQSTARAYAPRALDACPIVYVWMKR